MVFSKNKYGSISVLLLLCLVIVVILEYMVQNAVQLNTERHVFEESYQSEILDISVYSVCSSSILGLLDNCSFESNELVFTLEDIKKIQNDIYNILSVEPDFILNNDIAINMSEIRCTLNGHIIVIDNIDKEIINHYDFDGNLVWTEVIFHIENSKISIVSE